MFQYHSAWPCVCIAKYQRKLQRSEQACTARCKGKCKGSPCAIIERRVPELIPVLGSQPAGDGDVNHKVGCRYFSPGLQLPLQPLRGLLPILLLGEQQDVLASNPLSGSKYRL